MAERGRVWSDEEIQLLLALWSDDTVQRELLGAYRKDPVWQKLADDLTAQGFERTSKQVATKIKQLKKQYKDAVDKLRRSGMGLESDDEDEIYVKFKWFFEIHNVMKRRAVVNPPALLESSIPSSSCSDTAEVGEGSDSTAMTTPYPSPLPLSPFSNDNEAATSDMPMTPPSQVASIATTPSQVAATTLSLGAHVLPTTTCAPSQVIPSTTVTFTTTPAARPRSSTSTSTSANSNSSAGPSKKKRKLTKMEKADKTTSNMFEVMMKVHQEIEERQEEQHQRAIKKQEEQIRSQEEFLKRQEEREERFMGFMQQMLTMMMPAAQTQMPIHPMYSMPPPSASPPSQPAVPSGPYPQYPPYTSQDPSMQDEYDQ